MEETSNPAPLTDAALRAALSAFTCDTLGVKPGGRWDVIIDCDNPGGRAFHRHILGMLNALIVQA